MPRGGDSRGPQSFPGRWFSALWHVNAAWCTMYYVLCTVDTFKYQILRCKFKLLFPLSYLFPCNLLVSPFSFLSPDTPSPCPPLICALSLKQRFTILDANFFTQANLEKYCITFLFAMHINTLKPYFNRKTIF